MKNNLKNILLTILFTLLSSSVFAITTHSVSDTDCAPVVTIVATPTEGASSWAYEEKVSSLTPSDISENGVFISSLGVIRWGAFLDNNERTFTYTLSGADGEYAILGTESRDGVNIETDETVVTIFCNPPLEQVATPVFDPTEGTGTPVSVTITSATSGAVIYYALDGSKPTTGSNIYSGPVNIDDLAILQAIAVKTGMADSEIASAVYRRPYSSPADILERSVTFTDCHPSVNISVTPAGGALAYGVEEEIPLGLVADNISDSGVWIEEESVIRWGTFLDGDSRILTYNLSGPDGVYNIFGSGSFDGRGQDISGTNEITIDCLPDQAIAPVFDPPAGSGTPVTIEITSATEGAEIRYTLNGTDPDETSTLYEKPILLYTRATIKAKAFKTGLAPSNTAQAEYSALNRAKAIIVAGSGPFEGNSLWPATRHICNYAYQALLYHGYGKDDIMFLSHDLTVDVDGNGELDDIDALATSANLEQAITTWAKDGNELLLFITGHGGNGAFMLGQNDILDVANLKAWLDMLQDTIPGRVIIIYDACQSGTFIPALIPLSGKGRITMSSAANEPALFLEGGALSFSYQFWTSLFRSGRLYDAFVTGRSIMLYDQSARLDANANGNPNEKQDKIIAADIIIGRGMTAASVPPDIQSYSGDQTLETGVSADIWADDIESLNLISRVWAVIMPPDYRAGDVNSPITDLPVLEMTDPDMDGRYEGTYTSFTMNGTYRIMIYARDSQGGLSLPRLTSVVQNGGFIPDNNTPVAKNRSIATNEDVSIHDGLIAEDPDNDMLTYIIVDYSQKGTVTITDLHSGTFNYQPHQNESGADAFTFKANDGHLDSNVATVTITINPVEDLPVANNMDIVTEKNNPVISTLTAVDGDGDQVAFAISVFPDHGNVSILDTATGEFTYTPAEGYYGPDSFSFTADDGKGISLPGTVNVDVERGYNNPPVASDSVFDCDEDTPFNGNLSGYDPDGDPIIFILVTAPGKGTLELTNAVNGTIIYTPDKDLNGEDSFSYKVKDSRDESDPAICTISINPVNDPPVGENSHITVENLSGVSGNLNGSDVENDALVYFINTNGTMGAAVITDASTGAYSYTPYSTENGSDSFTFIVSDSEDDSVPASATINIRIPQADISRTIAGNGCEKSVSVTVAPLDNVRAYALEEQIEEGLIPEDVNADGVWIPAGRTIRWGTFLDNASRTFTYTLTGDDGDYEFRGKGSFNGWDQDIAGDNQTTIDCAGLRVESPVFDPPDGALVPVAVEISCPTEGAEIRYTTDESTPSSDSQLYTAPLYLDEAVVVKARAYKEGMRESNTATADYRSTRGPKAIIVAGGGPYTGNSLWDATMLIGEYAYKALMYQGYSREDIMFLSAGPDMDLDGNGLLDDIDGYANSGTLEDAVTNWALDAENLMIFLVDHGGENTFLLNETDILNAGIFRSWLDILQEQMKGRVVVINEACRAGTFIKELSPPAGKERILISSASDESAWFLWGGKLSFSYQFWASVFAKANIYDAFLRGMGLMTSYQTALVDADGNGIPGENTDYSLLSGISVGRGAVAAGVPPVIGYVSAPKTIYDSVASLKAGDITSLNKIEKVWAIIISPNYQPASSNDPVTDMVELDLTDPDNTGVFEVLYDGFDTNGVYRLTVYARDSEGLFSDPVEITITREKPALKGDVDNNDIVEMKDAVLSFQVCAKIPVDSKTYKEADVNGDGKIGLEEVIYVLQEVAEE